eukprot:scaffold16831_cov54-Phaeocystis_antarctica.AAC.3
MPKRGFDNPLALVQGRRFRQLHDHAACRSTSALPGASSRSSSQSSSHAASWCTSTGRASNALELQR